ncbi:MAG: hypothetical protein KC636_30805 [Myxococcales bacterium]|nr:hypothetical protein [Myxococcales bacterium]
MSDAKKAIEPDELVVHILNVGFGDTSILEFPASADGVRRYAVVDCCAFDKVRAYVRALAEARGLDTHAAILCATHPHSDHVRGMAAFIDDEALRPYEFWDSGFRHTSRMYQEILIKLHDHTIPLVRASSGMERYFGRIQVTVLAPSVRLRNRYATYGVDMNNASIVLRVEHHRRDRLLAESDRYQGARDPELERKAGPSVVLLGGDAEFDSWSTISQEYPHLERSSRHEPTVRKVLNPLACSVVKVSHHGSMHSIPLDVYERMSPRLAVISTKQVQSSTLAGGRELVRGLFPHATAALALQEVGATVLTTDGSYEAEPIAVERGGAQGVAARDQDNAHPGTIVIAIPPGGRPRWTKLSDTADEVPPIVNAI